MKYFFHDIESDKRVKLEVDDGVTCKQLKSILEDKFQLDTSSFKIKDVNSETSTDFEKRIILEYAGSDLNDNWVGILSFSFFFQIFEIYGNFIYLRF